MGLNAQMLFRSPRVLGDAEVARLDHDLIRTFPSPLGCESYEDQLGKVAIDTQDFGEQDSVPREEMFIPPENRAGGTWYRVFIRGRYYGVGYEKGDLWGFIGIAEWLEFRVPGSEVWYGSDADDFLQPFPKAVREVVKKHFLAIGHGKFANP